MTEHKKLSEQFETIDLGDVSVWREAPRHARTTVPKVPEGHTRLWRSTSRGYSGPGHWADRPLPNYGTGLYYMDLPHEEAERHQINKRSLEQSRERSGISGPKVYLVPIEGQHHPMPGPTHKAPYEYYEKD